MTRFVAASTVGYDELAKVVRGYHPIAPPASAGSMPSDIRAAARLIGTSERLVSTCLQGVYQSHQATAAACQVNNITLLRGMIGRPGCTVFQMNGQPTAQNTRETGADGDLTGMRNWHNPAHVAELARLWNVDPLQIPSWAPPTHAMQIFRYAEQGSIRFLWVTGTNPAVSLPDLDRIRSILQQERLFLVVTDAFLSETGRARRRRAPRGDLGREGGHVHQPRSHRPPLGAGGRSAGTRPAGHGHLPGLRRAARPDGPRRPTTAVLDDTRGVLRRLQGGRRAAVRATTAA